MPDLRAHALDIWHAAVRAAAPAPLVEAAARRVLADRGTGRVLVVGCGKAGAEMAKGLEAALVGREVIGVVNVPESFLVPLSPRGEGDRSNFTPRGRPGRTSPPTPGLRARRRCFVCSPPRSPMTLPSA